MIYRDFRFFYFFEAGVLVVALVLLALFPEKLSFHFDFQIGVLIFASTALLLGLANLLDLDFFQRFASVRKLDRFLSEGKMGAFIRRGDPLAFFILSLFAGWGEELLFRAFLQAKIGIFFSCLLFALAHAMNLLYFFVSFFISFVLAYLYQINQNILLVANIHCFYDFFALLLFQRKFSARQNARDKIQNNHFLVKSDSPLNQEDQQ